jgi:sporulation protein YlmC with PRC-barrel domain
MTKTVPNKTLGNKTLGAIIAAALVTSTAIAPAFAQTNNATPAAPSAPTMQAEPKGMAPAASANSDMPATGNAAYLTQQSQTQVSANDYIGKSIYNTGDESIGDVNDLIMEDNGGIVAAVVGVGGFLGIGEKDVALPIDKITMARDAKNNEVRLTTTETAEALKAAPEFKTLDDVKSGTDATTTSSTSPATTTPGTTPSTGGETNSSTAAPKQ